MKSAAAHVAACLLARIIAAQEENDYGNADEVAAILHDLEGELLALIQREQS